MGFSMFLVSSLLFSSLLFSSLLFSSLLFSSLLFSSLLFSSLLFFSSLLSSLLFLLLSLSSLLFSSLLFSSCARGSNPNLFLSQLTLTVIAMQFHLIEFYFIIYQNSSHGPVFQHKCPNEKNGQETEWHFVLSVWVCVYVCVSVCACLWHWKGQKKVRLIEWDCCRKNGKIERFLKSPVRWRDKRTRGIEVCEICPQRQRLDGERELLSGDLGSSIH